ncbi:hypothetical protein Vretifemale_3999, partial [Volvox reticuliferus]
AGSAVAATAQAPPGTGRRQETDSELESGEVQAESRSDMEVSSIEQGGEITKSPRTSGGMTAAGPHSAAAHGAATVTLCRSGGVDATVVSPAGLTGQLPKHTAEPPSHWRCRQQTPREPLTASLQQKQQQQRQQAQQQQTQTQQQQQQQKQQTQQKQTQTQKQKETASASQSPLPPPPPPPQQQERASAALQQQQLPPPTTTTTTTTEFEVVGQRIPGKGATLATGPGTERPPADSAASGQVPTPPLPPPLLQPPLQAAPLRVAPLAAWYEPCALQKAPPLVPLQLQQQQLLPPPELQLQPPHHHHLLHLHSGCNWDQPLQHGAMQGAPPSLAFQALSPLKQATQQSLSPRQLQPALERCPPVYLSGQDASSSQGLPPPQLPPHIVFPMQRQAQDQRVAVPPSLPSPPPQSPHLPPHLMPGDQDQLLPQPYSPTALGIQAVPPPHPFVHPQQSLIPPPPLLLPPPPPQLQPQLPCLQFSQQAGLWSSGPHMIDCSQRHPPQHQQGALEDPLRGPGPQPHGGSAGNVSLGGPWDQPGDLMLLQGAALPPTPFSVMGELRPLGNSSASLMNLQHDHQGHLQSSHYHQQQQVLLLPPTQLQPQAPTELLASIVQLRQSQAQQQMQHQTQPSVSQQCTPRGSNRSSAHERLTQAQARNQGQGHGLDERTPAVCVQPQILGMDQRGSCSWDLSAPWESHPERGRGWDGNQDPGRNLDTDHDKDPDRKKEYEQGWEREGACDMQECLQGPSPSRKGRRETSESHKRLGRSRKPRPQQLYQARQPVSSRGKGDEQGGRRGNGSNNDNGERRRFSIQRLVRRGAESSKPQLQGQQRDQPQQQAALTSPPPPQQQQQLISELHAHPINQAVDCPAESAPVPALAPAPQAAAQPPPAPEPPPGAAASGRASEVTEAPKAMVVAPAGASAVNPELSTMTLESPTIMADPSTATSTASPALMPVLRPAPREGKFSESEAIGAGAAAAIAVSDCMTVGPFDAKSAPVAAAAGPGCIDARRS